MSRFSGESAGLQSREIRTELNRASALVRAPVNVSRRIQFPVQPHKVHLALLISTAALAFAPAPGRALFAQTSEPRSTKSYAQAVGVPLNTIIIFGDQYNGGDELYDVRITVKEVVRGEKAWQMVKGASASNQPAGAGYDYVLARVRFEFSARTAPEHYSYVLDQAQFTAMSRDNKPYDPAVLARQLEPTLHATLRSGDSAEGWVAFLVPRGDHTPLMLFREDVGNLSHEGNGSIFKLYYENPSAGGKAKPS
jgi:hypothetical protein